MQNNIYFKIQDLENSSNKYIVNQYIIDIRNMKKLDKEMLHTISLMSNEDKMLIITAYNDMIGSFASYLDIMK